MFDSDTEPKNFPNGVRILPVRNKQELKQFYQISFRIYQNNPYWIPPFWSEMKEFFHKKNPFWTHAECALFLAKKNNEVVGRIAAIIDYAYCKTIRENIGYFGFFECIQDYDCASALIHTAEEWLTRKEMTAIRGPIDGRVDVGCGFLYTGFDSPPSILSTYTPPYYVSFVEKHGFKQIRKLLLYTIDLTKPFPKQLEEKAKQCATAGIQIRPFHRLRTGKELKWWVKLFLDTFSDHWGFVPVSEDEVRTRFGIKQLRWIVDPKLFIIAEFGDTPVAYLWSTPDYNQIFRRMNGRLGPIELLKFIVLKRKIDSGKLHFIGIKRGFRNQNIGSYLNYEVLKEMKKRGYRNAEAGWIDEQNKIAQTTIAITGATVHKEHRVFEKELKKRKNDEKEEYI